MQAGLALQGARVGKLSALDAQTTDKVLERMYEVKAAGGSYREQIEARRSGFDQVGRTGSRLYYGGYAVQDGAIILGALTPLNREQMRRAIGVADDPTADPGFDSRDPENRKLVDQMLERIRAIMLTKTMDEWIEAFSREGAPASRVHFPEELADDPPSPGYGLHDRSRARADRARADGRPHRHDVPDADGLTASFAAAWPSHRRGATRARHPGR